jgi:hypothetical protein
MADFFSHYSIQAAGVTIVRGLFCGEGTNRGMPRQTNSSAQCSGPHQLVPHSERKNVPEPSKPFARAGSQTGKGEEE